MQPNKKYSKDGVQYAMYPNAVMNITQTINGSYSHRGTNAIDDAQANTGISNGYAPCDMVCVATGLNQTEANAVFWQSQNPVITRSHGTQYIHMMVLHDNTANAYVGMKIAQGQQMFSEGTAGNATGNHNHFELALGKWSGTKYVKSGYLTAWGSTVYMMPNNINPAEILFVDDTNIMNGGGLNWGKIGTQTSSVYNDSQLIKEHAKATFQNDSKIIIHRDSPTGASYGSFVKGEVQEYTEKWVGLGHRWISWIHTNGVRCFAAISGSETAGKDLWATFSSVESNTDTSQSSGTISLTQEDGIATFTVDGVRARYDSPTGDVYKVYNKGDLFRYYWKYVGKGHRYVVGKDGDKKIFIAVSATEDKSEMWATFSAPKDESNTSNETPKQDEVKEDTKVDYTKNVKGYGIDISEHNSNIDVSKYDFVILRACYGENTDKLFESYVKQCEEAGIPYGVYCYDYALNDDEAKAEAEYILKLIEGKNIQMGVWFDMEDADGYKKKKGVLTKERCTNSCKIFCDILKQNGYYTGIYTSSSWINNYVVTDYPLWVANWGVNDGNVNSDQSNVGVMHQYSANPLDKDVIYHDIDFYKSNPIKVEEPKKDEVVEPTPTPSEPKEDEKKDDSIKDDQKENDESDKNNNDTENKKNTLLDLLIQLVKKLLNIFK